MYIVNIMYTRYILKYISYISCDVCAILLCTNIRC